MLNASIQPSPSPKPTIQTLTGQDLVNALWLGWGDFVQNKAIGVLLASVFVLGGIAVVFFLSVTGQIWWAIPITLGFPLLGPFTAVGFYEMSRRQEAGEKITLGSLLAVILAQTNRQLPVMAWVMLVFFLFWNFLAHMIFALFMGLEVMTNISSSYDVFFSFSGLMMLAVGTIVGGVLSACLFSITVISLPLLLDKELDFVTAMIHSVQTCLQNKRVMFAWGCIVAILIGFGILTAFLGLFLTLPLLGHASWYLYRAALSHPLKET